MKNLYKPTIYAKDIFSINYQRLKNKNIDCLLFDLDNTIADSKVKKPSSNIVNLFNNLKKMGFKIYIISNAFKYRVNQFTKELNIKGYHLSHKPSKRKYLKIIKENNLCIRNIAAIGDQLYTDILGANKMNITSILVDKISNNESSLTKLIRLRENRLINKTKIIERGTYYE